MSEKILHLKISHLDYGLRLDQFLARELPDYSRSRIQKWIKDGLVTLNGEVVPGREKLKVGGEVQVNVEAALEAVETENWDAQPIPLDVVYEDEHIMVIDKPSGLVVHPGAGNPDNTMVNALVHHDAALAKVPRAGVVHRLDKETTGLLVVARTIAAHTRLVEALQDRDFDREYLALVWGEMTAGGMIDEPIGRHPSVRTRQAVSHSGKPALTHYRLEERFRAHTLLRVKLDTGRTHQIRVHMAYIKHPIVGDPVYGGRLKIPPAASAHFAECLRGFKRQALHAQRLGLEHPITGEYMSWESPIPEDLKALISAMREDYREHKE
ncbi:MAG: 23S rRNA pseudouridine(1911/1915/1917) synthase RluD [Gammaproteobacteria bacterium]|nr:23S rRNA pseudouridine(1911/1915/1917) synthase RluD [Gammaproteobacteria bacterium]